jgi:hypothetical protein
MKKETNMEIEGGGKLAVYPAQDELPHEPGSHVNWQESFVIIFNDEEQSVGGFFRLGHEPNFNGGQTQIFSNIFSPSGTYHRSCHIPLKPEHRKENGFTSGDNTLSYEVVDGEIKWQLKDDDIEMNLTVDSFVPPYDVHRQEGQDNAESYTGSHVDVACWVSGTVTVKGTTYTLDKVLGFRDHGWGNRAWTTLYSHRWTVGIFDEENSFFALTLLNSDYELAKFGYVIRSNKIIFATDVETRAIIGEDGGTNYGGTTKMTLTTGEVFEVKFEPHYPSIASWIHNTICYDTMSKITSGDKTGFGIFESTSNNQGGTRRPMKYVDSVGLDGWYEGSELVKRL